MVRCDTLSDLRDLLEKQGLEIIGHDLDALWEGLPHVRRICEHLCAIRQNDAIEHSHLFSVLSDNLVAERFCNANTNDC
ncbi:hypothetical protein B0G82_7681 [Paraburkholderia sp. BL17N1]|nr:hypothetical protein B0G82_7681 [Paraburkholderia sp. BL17N1]